jgi:hypothetical protein
LERDRFVEAQVVAEHLGLVRRRVQRQENRSGISCEPGEREHDYRDTEEDNDTLEEPTRNKRHYWVMVMFVGMR